MLTLDISQLKNKKNLLAFSAGVDSSALFFLLLDHHITFDIAIVDYGLRAQSKEEVAHAKKLAQTHDLQCYSITGPNFDTHFEKKARDFRYQFFESIIAQHGYDTLLTAHQLNDQLEWMLMRLSKGAGVSELLGLEPISHRKNYTLIRPLLAYSKEELLAYLDAHQYSYFIDDSNLDEKYERNRFRKQFSDALMAEYKEGIQRSFEYLRKDKEVLEQGFEILFSHKALRVIQLHDSHAKVKAIDQTLKKLGYLLSALQRKEIEKETSLVIGGKWAISMQNDLLYIAPYLSVDMTKKFKEACRILKIPSKIRAYCFSEEIEISNLP